MLVAGEWAEARSGETFEVTNPANGDVIQAIPNGGREDASRAIDAAYNAFPAWAGTTAYDRPATLYRAWQLMVERKDQLARTMTEDAKVAEMDRAARVERRVRPLKVRVTFGESALWSWQNLHGM